MIRLLSRTGLLLACTALLVSCTFDTTVVTVGSPDGFLDCGDGEIPRSGDIFTSGDNEQQVVEEALAAWLEDGASLANPTEAEVWSAVIEGREVALAVPEREGDGGWVVADVRMCGEPDTGPAEIDGSIDCAGDGYWDQQATMDPEIPGEAMPEESVRVALEPCIARPDG